LTLYYYAPKYPLMMTSKPVRILFIDDDEDDFVIIKELLHEIDMQRFEVEWASSYSKAITVIEERRHDVYLVDYRLGEQTGIYLMKKAISLGCDEPFIMLTGKGDQKIDLEAMKSGAADYLVKDKIDAYSLERTIRYAIERKVSLDAIKESELKYRSIFEQSKDVIFVINKDGYFIDINESAIRMFGYTRKELVQLNLIDLLAESSDKEYFSGLLAQREDVLDYESVLLGKSGIRIFALVSVSLQQGSEEDSTFYQGIIHDITLRKKAEQELVMSEKLAVTGKLAQIVAHEVRNPLTNVNLALEQLKHEIHSPSFDKADADPFFDIIIRNSDRINQLITELLNSSRHTDLKLTEYPINNVLDESLELAGDRIKLKEIKVEKEYRGTEGRKVFMDPEKIKIAILNILINAVEAMEPRKGVLRVRNESRSGKCIISISDNGAGINRENLNRLFDPFYTGKSKGMGLGLTTTQSIVLNHKGTIDVESEPGKGTTFIIGLES
jgi:PAS domain S-box-containing protein